MQTKYITYSSGTRPSLLRKAGALVVTIALASVALMFSAVLLALVLIAVVFGGAYLWWKTREIRKQMRDFPPPAQSATMQRDAFAGEVFDGEVIEGEAVRVDESQNRIQR